MYFVTVTDEKGHTQQVSLKEFWGLCNAEFCGCGQVDGCEEPPCDTGEDEDDAQG